MDNFASCSVMIRAAKTAAPASHHRILVFGQAAVDIPASLPTTRVNNVTIIGVAEPIGEAKSLDSHLTFDEPNPTPTTITDAVRELVGSYVVIAEHSDRLLIIPDGISSIPISIEAEMLVSSAPHANTEAESATLPTSFYCTLLRKNAQRTSSLIRRFAPKHSGRNLTSEAILCEFFQLLDRVRQVSDSFNLTYQPSSHSSLGAIADKSTWWQPNQRPDQISGMPMHADELLWTFGCSKLPRIVPPQSLDDYALTTGGEIAKDARRLFPNFNWEGQLIVSAGFHPHDFLEWETSSTTAVQRKTLGLPAEASYFSPLSARSVAETLLSLPKDERTKNRHTLSAIQNGKTFSRLVAAQALTERAGPTDSTLVSLDMETDSPLRGLETFVGVRTNELVIPAEVLSDAGAVQATATFDSAQGGFVIRFRTPYAVEQPSQNLAVQLLVNGIKFAQDTAGVDGATQQIRVTGLSRGDRVSLRIQAMKPLPASWTRPSRMRVEAWEPVSEWSDLTNPTCVSWSSATAHIIDEGAA